MEYNVEKDFVSTSSSWSGNNNSKDREKFKEVFNRKCGLKIFVGLLTIILILIALIAGFIMMDMEIQSLKLQNQDFMPEKQFFKNEQSSEMERLKLQNQNLTLPSQIRKHHKFLGRSTPFSFRRWFDRKNKNLTWAWS